MKVLLSQLFTFIFLTLLILPGSAYSEGTKEVIPDSTVSGGSLCISYSTVDYSTRFANFDCAPNYRLYIHVKAVNETILFGLGLGGYSGITPRQYKLRKPDGTVVLTANCPTAGNPGFITYFHQAQVGPFPASGGYTPLQYKITNIADTGNYYLEFSYDITFKLYDFTVVSGLNPTPLPSDVKHGRVFSQAWQFTSSYQKAFEPFSGSFYIYSDDGIVTKLAFSQAAVGIFSIFCNQYGCKNTGNWNNDRKSTDDATYLTFPGIAQYKVFLNNPDSLVYPNGVYGQIVGTPYMTANPDFPACSGKKSIYVNVNKAGTVHISIACPSGNNIAIDSVVHFGVNRIDWNGNDGLGVPVPDGSAITMTIDFINGLTNLPIWDVERNANGFRVSLVRPVFTGMSSPLTFWDDRGLTTSAQCVLVPNTYMLTPGCLPGINGCHIWATCTVPYSACNCHNKMINTWWFSASSSTATVNVTYIGIPPAPTPSDANRCGPGTVTINATALPGETIDWYANPSGGTALLSGNTAYTTPVISSTTTYWAEARNTTSGCLSLTRTAVNATIKPLPTVIFTPANRSICTGDTAKFTLTSNGTSPSFSWTATCTNPNISGYANGSSSLISQKLINAGTFSDTVWYHVTATAQSCTGPVYHSYVVVNAKPLLTNNPVRDTICSENFTNINLTASYPGTTFSWNGFPVSGSITGYSAGIGNTIAQNLKNLNSTLSWMKYTITMNNNGCIGRDTNFFVFVKPKPKLTTTPLTAAICSGSQTNIPLTSDVAGTWFTWTASGSSANVSGFGGGSGSTIAQTLVNSGLIAETVTYRIVPHATACGGDTTNYVVTVNPSPNLSNSPLSKLQCSNTSTNLTLTSNIPGALFTWTCTPGSLNIPGIQTMQREPPSSTRRSSTLVPPMNP